jgi:ABC-type dipeptide/oligopeptide/nickel transport system ATPase component
MANAIVRYNGKPKSDSWARWMIGRTIRKNQNNLVSVIGKTGSGKTWSAISICEIMSKMDGVPFNVEHIVFSLRALMDLINSGNLKRGSKIIFDEPQVSISAREFQSEANKVFNYLLSTFRHRNLTLFFCTPYESLLDKNTRRLFHVRIETLSINPNNKTCKLKPRFIEYSDFKSEAYRKQLIVCYKDEKGNTKNKKVFYWDVPKPSEKLIEEYEKKKLDFTNNLNKNISERLKKYDDAGNSLTAEYKEPSVERKPLTQAQERVMKVFANIKENDKFKCASKKLEMSMSAIHQHIKLAKKKGYMLEEFEENVK